MKTNRRNHSTKTVTRFFISIIFIIATLTAPMSAAVRPTVSFNIFTDIGAYVYDLFGSTTETEATETKLVGSNNINTPLLAPLATIFTETVGTGTPNGTAIGSYTGWSNPSLIFTGTGDIRNTSTSTGYAGSSGAGNIFLTNVIGRDFQIAGINTSTYSSASLSLSFGVFKSTTASNGSDLIVEVSSDGTTYTPLSFTALPTGAGTATWNLRTASGTIPSTANLRIRFRQSAAATQYRIDDIQLTGTVSASTPTQLAITNISPASPTAGSGFNVTVQSQDAGNIATNVTANTDFTLSNTGGGAIGGTTTGTITTGTNQIVVSGVTLSSAATGVTLTATRTSGDTLTAGTSAPFNVLAAASQIAFVGVPAAGTSGANLTAFNVEARRPDNTLDSTYTGNIVITKASGAGTLSGTTAKAAVAGVATYNDLQFNAAGSYTLNADSSTFTQITSGTIVVSDVSLASDYFRSNATGNWNSAATWESSHDGATWFPATLTPTSTANTITVRNGHTVTISASVTYDQVTVDAGGQVTVASTITSTLANGTGEDLIINGTWLNSGGTWTTTGDWTVNAGGTYIHNTTSGIGTPLNNATLNASSNFVYRGSSTLTPAGSFTGRTYGNLSIESTSGLLTLPASGATLLTVNGNLSVGNSGAGTVTFSASSFTAAVNIAGNVTIDAGSAFTAGSNTNSVGGNWTNNGAFNASSSTVSFNGAGLQTIGGASATAFNNLTINKATGTALLGADASANALSVQSGTFSQGSAANVTAGTATVAANGVWINSGTGDLNLGGAVSNAGTIAFDANGAGCGADDILIRSTVSGFQRAWSGFGTFTMSDVDVKDQSGTAIITVNSGTDSGTNGLNWLFVPTCAGGIYTWNGATLADWSVAANWTPARIAPNASDILIIDGAVTSAPIITNVPTQTIAALRITNNAQTELRAFSVDDILTVSGATGTDLAVPAGTLLKLSGSNALTISVASGSQGNIAGTFILDGIGHRLIGGAAGAINFQFDSICTTSDTFAGYPFGDGSAGNGANGSIVFLGGSTYFHNAGESPFGAASASVASFQTASTAVWLKNEGFQASGRTYSNLIVGSNSPGANPVNLTAGGAGDFRFDNLTINSTNLLTSSLTFNGSGANTVTINGDITSIGAGAGGTNPDVNITAGAGGIVLSKNGTQTFGGGNGRTVTFNSGASVSGSTTLALSRNLIVAPASSVLSINGNLTAGATGYVIGNLKKTFSAAGAKTFEVGTVNGYSPVDADVTAGAGDLTVKAVQSQQPFVPGTRALLRYWTISEGGDITADLTFNYLTADIPGTATEANFKLFKYDGALTQVASTLDAVNNKAAATGITSFSDWTLAEPSVNISVSLPSGLLELNNTTLTIPVTVSDTTGNGINTYDFAFSYDSSVLSPLAVPFDKTGTLSENFTVTPDASTPGSLLISGAGATLSGAGTLIYLKFNIVGAPPACSAFSFSAFEFNDGQPNALLTGPGGVCVRTGNIAGRVTYGTSPTLQLVPGVTITAAGSPNLSDITDAGGLYNLSGFGPGAYTVTPSKTGDIAPASISGHDASLAAQHAVGIINLDTNRQIVADVSGNGAISSFDAGLIAQYVVGITTNQTNRSGLWKFIQPSKTYPNVWADYGSEDFVALLMGDLTGSWTPSGMRADTFDELRADAVRLTMADASVSPDNEIVLPVNISDVTNRGIYSFDFEINFDPEVLELDENAATALMLTEEESLTAVNPGGILSKSTVIENSNTLSRSYSYAVNRTAKGVLKITGYGVSPLEGAGELLRLKFRAGNGKGGIKTKIGWTSAMLNEGSIPVIAAGAAIFISQSAGRQ